MFSVAALAPVLQALFTTRADELAKATHFIRRNRGFTGAQFLQALVLGWHRRPHATLEDLALPLGVSRQALQQRWTAPCADFCRRALLEAVGCAFQARPETLPLLERFAGVFIDDSTQLWLPDGCADAFPGNNSDGPGAGRARMKALVRWEVQGGRVCHLGIHPGRTADPTAQADAPPLPPGSLSLADLGFIDFGRLRALSEGGVYWVSRLPAQTRLSLGGWPEGTPLWEQLRAWRKAGQKRLDVAARVGAKEGAWGRLVALACPEDVAARRLRRLERSARDRGRPVSERQRELCRWTVLFSNVPADWLSVEQLWLVYRLRWQVELLFKRLKSEGGMRRSRSEQPARVECEWYLKLLGQVVRNWLQLLRGGPMLDVNPKQMGRVIGDWLHVLFRALPVLAELERVVAQLQQELLRLRRRTHRRSRKTMREMLHDQRVPAT